mgnify:FL=1
MEEQTNEALWYVVHTYSGYENKVANDLQTMVENRHLQDLICDIKVPTEMVPEIKDGKERTYYIYNNCDHEKAFQETGTQAVSFTTGVPAALGASMWAKGLWRGAGVFNVEEFDPDPFLAELGPQGLPWVEKFDVDLEV